jgi:uncharacterized membrane protein YdbT with pleckstrin-like domain
MNPDNVPALCSFGAIGLVILAGIAFYQFLDWNNDIYQLTQDSVLDTEKKPLGRAITKSAPIKNILSIEHAKEGILNLILNFGDVRINVADTTLEFFNVYNPAQVQQEIITRMEEVRLQEEQKEAQDERSRMGEWLKAYHEVWQEEQEQQEQEKNE